MIIRCPQCEHTRTISESKIPPAAENATCPRCGHRFRFRTVARAPAPDGETPVPSAPRPTPEKGLKPSNVDIWEAVETMNQRWQAQLDQNVTEVVTPRPARSEEASPAPKPVEPNKAPSAQPVAEEPAFAMPSAPEKAQESPAAASAPAVAPVFPTYDDTPPEERVERDLNLLRENGERPSRDLGRLDEHSDLPTAEDDAEDEGEKEELPFENPSRLGWVKSLTATIRAVMLDSGWFFSNLSAAGSPAYAYLFFLFTGYTLVLGSVLWGRAAADFLPPEQAAFLRGLGPAELLLLAPIALGMAQLLLTSVLRIMVSFLAPRRAHFSLVFKTASYATAPLVLGIVPFVGPAAGIIWTIISLIVGCRKVFRLSWPAAVGAALPPALLVLGIPLLLAG